MEKRRADELDRKNKLIQGEATEAAVETANAMKDVTKLESELEKGEKKLKEMKVLEEEQ